MRRGVAEVRQAFGHGVGGGCGHLAGEAAVREEEHGVRVRGGDRVVRHHDDGPAVQAHGFLEEAQDVARAAGVEGAGRFVREDHARFGDEGAGDGDTLALASGELVGAVAEAVAEPDLGEDLLRAGPVDAPPGEPERQGGVLGDGQRRQQVVLLEDEADPAAAEPGEGRLGAARHLLAVDHHDAAVGPVQSGRALQERGLAGAGGPHHGGERPAPQTQGHVVECGHGVVGALTGPVRLADLDEAQGLAAVPCRSAAARPARTSEHGLSPSTVVVTALSAP